MPEQAREQELSRLTKAERITLAYRWEGWQARPAQEPPAGDWRFWLILAGRGFGKTRIGSEETRKAAQRVEFPNLVGATADDARDIMIEGESGILAVCPPWERPTYQPSRRQLSWPNGAKSLIFTADEPERLRGKQHTWLWCDEIASWRYPEAWDQAMFGLRLGPNPQAVVTTTPKPTPLVRELVRNPLCAVTRGSTYDNIANLADAFADEIIRKYEGTRLGRQELLGELLEDQGLAYAFSESLHVVEPFELPDSWDRFESMDYGSSDQSATCWLAYAVDWHGNIVVFDELYEPGLPSVTAPKVHARRQWWHPSGETPVCYADPAIFNPGQTTGQWGRPAVVRDEFVAQGIRLAKGNPEHVAGYVRIAEMLKLDESRDPPGWAVHLAASAASPRLFVFSRCSNLIRQLKEAPLEEADPGPLFGPHPGEAVAGKWESRHGHAHAALRYGLLTSRHAASKEPEKTLQQILLEPEPEVDLRRERFQKHLERVNQSGSRRRRSSYTT